MTNKKEHVKLILIGLCDWVSYSYNTKGHDGFSHKISDYDINYLLYDKAMAKRIKKRLKKVYNLNARVDHVYNMGRFESEIRIRIFSRGRDYVRTN